MSYQSNLGRNIRSFRKLQNWTLKELADRSGIDAGTLSRLERGEAGISTDNVQKLCQAFGISEGVLFADEPSPAEPKHPCRSVPVLEPSHILGLHHGSLRPSEMLRLRHIPVDYAFSSDTFAVQGMAQGMQSVFNDLDYVVVDPRLKPMPGDFVIAVSGDTVVFRQFRVIEVLPGGQAVFELRPLNDVYPSIKSSVSGASIIGTMVEHRISRQRHHL